MEGVVPFREDDVDAYIFQFDEELENPHYFSKSAKPKRLCNDLDKRFKSLTVPWGSCQIFIQHSFKHPHFPRV